MPLHSLDRLSAAPLLEASLAGAEGSMKVRLWPQSLRLNLGSKIAFAVGAVLLLTAAVLAAVAVFDVAKLGAYLDSTHHDSFLSYERAAELGDALERTEIALLAAMSTSPAHRLAQRAVIDKERPLIAAALRGYSSVESLTTVPEIRKLLEERGVLDDHVSRERSALATLHSGLPELDATVDSVWRLVADERDGDARAAYQERAEARFERAIDATSALMAIQLDESAEATRAGRAVVRRTERLIAITIQAAFLLAIAAILILTRHITRPLRALVVGTDAVKRGDLSQAVPVTSCDEIGVLATAFNQMIAQIERSQRDVVASRDRAMRASHAKSDFLASMSHELRTPLGSIIGFTNVLRKNTRGNLLPADLQYLERVHTNGTHLLGLINEILDLARLESGKVEIHRAPTDVGRLVRDVVELLEGEAMTKPVSVVVDVPSDPVVLELDAENLKRVLINLAGNALKFTAVGAVTIRVASPSPNQRARIEVIDTGIGIPADRLDAIFEPFEQAGSSTTRTHGGTGLGLSISRSLCTAMGCDLNVESTVGVGSTFSVVLPGVEPTPTIHSAPPSGS